MTGSLVLAVISLVIATLALFACYEALKQVGDLRDYLNLRNDPIPLKLPHDPPATFASLLPSEIQTSPQSLLLFLSNRCDRCLDLAAKLDQHVPLNSWIIVEKLTDATALPISHLMRNNERVFEDGDGLIAEALGLATTPAVVRMSFGEVGAVYGVSSIRHIELLAPRLAAA